MLRTKTIYPAKGWLRVLWPSEYATAIGRVCIQNEVAEIPGCSLGPGSLDVPYTAWGLGNVVALLEQLGAKVPVRESLYSGDLPTVWGSRTLYSHQLDGVDFVCDHAGVIVADEMGTGKTATAIASAALCARRHSPRPVLIIGTKAVRMTWRNELEAMGCIQTPQDWCALASRDLDDTSFWKGAKWYFVHYEIVKAWWSLIYQTRPCVVIVDEAHYLSNGRTQRSSGAAMAVAGSAQRILLTGTPMENRPSDLYNLLTLACGPKTWGYPSIFRKRYCGAMSDGYALKDYGPTNISELRQRLNGVYIRRTTQDAGITLPSFTRTSQYCELGTARREHNDLIKRVERYELGTLPALVRAIAEGLQEKVLPEFTRLRQITSKAKVPATIEFVLNAMAQGEAVVVFTWERETAAKIFNGLGDYKKLLAHGSVSQALRDEAIDTFQRTEEPIALITTFGAMREGVTLHRARICVLHDLDWVLSGMLQAEKRVHRLGQTRNCQAVWMLAQDSMDTLIAPILLRKAQLMEEILGIKHDVRDDVGLTELAGRPDADALVAQAFDAWRLMRGTL